MLSLVAVSSSDAQINTTASVDQTQPSVAMDANGDYVVAWNEQLSPASAYNYEVEARVYNSAGQAQTNPIVVSTTKGNTRPSVAMDANGDFVVAWEVLNTSTYLYGIQAQRYNLAGTAQGSTISIGSGSSQSTAAEFPKVAMDSTGDFAIAYQGYDESSLGVFAQRYNASGVAQGSTIAVNSNTTGSQNAPSIAMDSSGNFVIAFDDDGQATAIGVYAQRYNASGVAQGGNVAISTIASTPGVSPPANPSVAIEPTGQYVIAWQYTQTASGTGNGDQTIAARAFAANGTASTGIIAVSTPQNEAQDDAAVAIDDEGDFVVTWAAGSTIMAQRFNASGTAIGANGGGSQFQPSTQTGDTQNTPNVASDPYGDTVIVWQSRRRKPTRTRTPGCTITSTTRRRSTRRRT